MESDDEKEEDASNSGQEDGAENVLPFNKPSTSETSLPLKSNTNVSKFHINV